MEEDAVDLVVLLVVAGCLIDAVPLGGVRRVVALHAELELLAFADFQVAVDGEIPVDEAGAAEDAFARIAQIASGGWDETGLGRGRWVVDVQAGS